MAKLGTTDIHAVSISSADSAESPLSGTTLDRLNPTSPVMRTGVQTPPSSQPRKPDNPLKSKSSRISVFNVKYSENLGDGLIAETMESGLAQTSREVLTYDLAGRKDYGQVTLRHRGLALAVLRAIPPRLRGFAVEAKLKPKLAALEPDWRAGIATADHVVIGGGHLFQDGDLNFPLKVGQVLRLAKEEATPVSIHGVGVTDHWSTRGRQLFRRLLDCEVGQISVRDAGSQAAWAKHFKGTRLETATIVPDPVIGFDAAQARPNGSIALCVTHPRVLSYHGGQGAHVHGFFAEIITELVSRRQTVTVFTNGAREDEQQADALFERSDIGAMADAGRVIRAKRPMSPQDLTEIVAAATLVIAHRLHAAILAYALGIPAIGLGWDRKLESFFAMTKREGYFLDPGMSDAGHVADLVESALSTGLDQDTRAALQSQASGALLTLGEQIDSLATRREQIQ